MNIEPPAAKYGERTLRSMAWLLAGVIGFVGCTWLALTQEPAPVDADWSNHATFWQPVERNAFLRLPRTGPVHALTFTPNGQRGWAISGLDMLLASDDGGATWSARSREALSATALAFSDDGKLGWALGPAMLRHTVDGGRHWTAVSDPVFPGRTWHALAFSSSGQNGAITSTDGALAVTRDGGKSWHLVLEKGMGGFGALNAAAWSSDGVNGWVAGDGGQLLLTTDGGRNWVVDDRDIPSSADLEKVRFLPDGLRGHVVSRDGAVYQSVNGGYRWKPMPLGNGWQASDIGFAPDGRRGWVVTTTNALLVTADGGAHWEQHVLLGKSRNFYAAMARDGVRLWVAGDWGIVASNDGGATVQAQTRDALHAIHALAFAADGVHGWAVGASGMIVQSDDGGATWTAQSSGTTADLHAVAVDARGARLWAAGAAGTLLSSTDAGRHWRSATLPGGADLRRIAFLKDGQRGVLVGAAGSAWYATDGGLAWNPARIGALPEENNDLAVTDDGAAIWISTTTGKLLRSSDAGKTWTPAALQAFPSTFPLGALPVGISGPIVLPQFSVDGKHGWISNQPGCTTWLTADAGRHWDMIPALASTSLVCVKPVVWLQRNGESGLAVRPGEAMLASEDGGRHWRQAWRPYRRSPGLWYFAALLPVCACLLLHVRRGRQPRPLESAAGMFVDDDAITAFDDDRLEFGPLARGLSRFLRNPRTSPPLTLSIVGDWGTGKSSLMRLLCADLRRYGQRPIWFNAWHHQKDEQLFAALLGTIQSQAAPSSWRPAGWVFRLKLLWIRSKRHFFLSFISLILVTSLFAFPVRHSISELGNVIDWLLKIPQWLKLEGAVPLLEVRQVGVLAQLAALLTGARLLYKGMQSFGVNPALMWKGVSDRVSLRQANAQNSFRTTFARQFEEVAHALPYRMTIVVDDLDRCRPENILEVLETVNFLTASGQCFVVFGMARERVLAALGMAFDKISEELAEGEATAEDGDVVEDSSANARARRRAYASDYLEKLINLEINVPQRGEIDANALFSPGSARPASALVAAGKRLRAAWPLWAAGVAVCAGIALATFPMPDPDVTQSAGPAPAPAASPLPAMSPTRPQSARRIDAPLLFPAFEQGQATAMDVSYGPPLLIGLILIGALAMHALARLRAQVIEVRDSRAFTNGLMIWTELAATRRDTPRAIKRWGNRLRYFAMLQQGSKVEETRGQRLRRKLGERLRKRAERTDGSSPIKSVCHFLAGLLRVPPAYAVSAVRYTIIDEGRLVAIGAAHQAYGKNWRKELNDSVLVADDDPVRRATRRYHDITGNGWTDISDEEADAFERLLAGIKLPPAAVEESQPRSPPVNAQAAPASRPTAGRSSDSSNNQASAKA